MSRDEKKWSRRDFLKAAGVAGVGSMLSTTGSMADDSIKLAEKTSKQIRVPTRPFGNTGVQVSMLALGCAFNTMSNQRLLRHALNWGVTYWETAEMYRMGKSEKGIGEYFSKYPDDRKKVFLVTKTENKYNPKTMAESLEESLKRLNTTYIDLYLWHMMSVTDFDVCCTKEAWDWVDKMKSDGKIRFFGFSTHADMEECLIKAVKLGRFDGIQLTHNFRIMHTDSMKKAVAVCEDAGIGLTAMKVLGTQLGWTRFPAHKLNIEEEELLSNLAGQFLAKGFDDKQARLMTVWQAPHIASITSYMPNMKVLKSNVDAALNWKKISAKDMSLLQKYADLTASCYCAGCANICESSIEGGVPISDVMRYLMYYHGYGDCSRARSLFREMPVDIRRKIASTDYTLAEKDVLRGCR